MPSEATSATQIAVLHANQINLLLGPKRSERISAALTKVRNEAVLASTIYMAGFGATAFEWILRKQGGEGHACKRISVLPVKLISDDYHSTRSHWSSRFCMQKV